MSIEKPEQEILERLKPARKVGVDATGMCMSSQDCYMVFSQSKWQKEIH